MPDIAFGIIFMVFSFETFVISVNGMTAEVSQRRMVEWKQQKFGVRNKRPWTSMSRTKAQLKKLFIYIVLKVTK